MAVDAARAKFLFLAAPDLADRGAAHPKSGRRGPRTGRNACRAILGIRPPRAHRPRSL
jgi:hypothetical protein